MRRLTPGLGLHRCQPPRPPFAIPVAAEDARLRPVLNRIEYLRRAGLTSLMVVIDFLRRRLAPLRECVRPAWKYTGSHDVTRTCIGDGGNLDEGALAVLLKVITGIEDLTRAVLPCEDLALCSDPGRTTLQESMPVFDAQGTTNHTGRRDPGTLHIPGVDDNEGQGTAAADGRSPSRGD